MLREVVRLPAPNFELLPVRSSECSDARTNQCDENRSLRILLLTLGNRVRGSVAGHAFLGRWLIKENRLGGDDFVELVACRAAHVLVRPSQGENRSLVMVE